MGNYRLKIGISSTEISHKHRPSRGKKYVYEEPKLVYPNWWKKKRNAICSREYSTRCTYVLVYQRLSPVEHQTSINYSGKVNAPEDDQFTAEPK